MSRTTSASRPAARRKAAVDPDPRVAALSLPRTPRDTILRPRLFDLLDAGVAERPLTIVSGPPGSGKTVLLASWLRERPPDAALAWVSLREADRAPFWRQVLDAVRPSVGRGTLLHGLDAPADDASPAFLERLVEALGELEPTLVLVVDDFQFAPAAAVKALDRILRAPPSRLRLVAASRIDPALSLHVLRVTGDLAEVRAGALALDEAETRELFARMGVALEEHQLEAVVRRTEGWAAGVRLFGLSLQARPAGVDVVAQLVVDERPVAEFLSAEVLATQPADVRAFLLRTSIVDDLDVELANRLSGRNDAERVLEQLLHENVFVERVPGVPRAYRYHQLFGALLRAEAEYELGPELADLHERAAVCLARRGQAAAAVRHGADAGRWELVARLLAEHWSAVLTAATGACAPFPPGHATASPVIAAFSGLVRIASGDTRGVAALLADARARRDEVPPGSQPGFDALVRHASALAARSRGNFAQAAKLAAEGFERAAVEAGSAQTEDERRALGLATLGAAQLWEGAPEEARSLLEEAVDVARRTRVTAAEIDALAYLALLELEAGHLRRAVRIARGALELERVRAHSSPAGVVARVVVARVQHEWGDADVAKAGIATASAATRRTGDVPGRLLGAMAAASLALSEGGDAADDALLQLRALRRRNPVATAAFGGRLAALEARLLASTTRLDEAAAVAGTYASSAAGDPDVAVADARIQLVLGSPRTALAALERRQGAVPCLEIEARVTESVARRAAGDGDAALSALDAALALAEPEAVRRPFIDAGSAARELLADHLRRTNAHRWLATELVAFADGRSSPDGGAPAELLEALSDRESEVLHYLPTIMSNADIAAELYVSVNTVKTHVKSIYRKLGANRRQDAVRRARQLRLL